MVSHADVIIGRHVIIGSGSVVLPGVNLEDGVAVGALSLVSKNCSKFGVYFGVPAKRIKERKNDLLADIVQGKPSEVLFLSLSLGSIASQVMGAGLTVAGTLWAAGMI